MDFGKALQELNKGKQIKVPEWGGYWFKEAGIIKVMTAEGEELDTPHFQQYIFRSDWKIVGGYTVTVEDLKGEIKDFPLHLVQLMVERQEEQGNDSNVSVFQTDVFSCKSTGGFDWIDTREGVDFWEVMIG